MDSLDLLEAESIFILREAYSRIPKIGMLWSLGKDSDRKSTRLNSSHT